MTDILRICLDLNIWCAALLADWKSKQNTACQHLVRLVREGHYLNYSTQLIISWGMLNRLRKVLVEDWRVSIATAELYLDTLVAYAQLGAMGQDPQLTLGGTGVIPLHDAEDAHVLETAIAGRAHVLVTANFRDFRFKDIEIIEPDRHGFYQRGDWAIAVVHPYQMMEWIRTDTLPLQIQP